MSHSDRVSGANRQTLRKLAVIAVLMFGFAYALVPMYEKLCEVTGINNLLKPKAPSNTQVDTSRTLTVEFDANLRSGLPWRFVPLTRKVQVHPGQVMQVMYEIENTSQRKVVAQAVPSYGPAVAAEYFGKLECFCFKQQVFNPSEKRLMPVVFVIDSALPAQIETVTLSYSFFEVAGTTN